MNKLEKMLAEGAFDLPEAYGKKIRETTLKWIDKNIEEKTKSLEQRIEELEKKVSAEDNKGSGYQCFHCGSYSVGWSGDFSFEDYGMEGEGIVNVCHCSNCGADIEYFIPCGEEEEHES